MRCCHLLPEYYVTSAPGGARELAPCGQALIAGSMETAAKGHRSARRADDGPATPGSDSTAATLSRILWLLHLEIADSPPGVCGRGAAAVAAPPHFRESLEALYLPCSSRQRSSASASRRASSWRLRSSPASRVPVVRLRLAVS